MIAVGEPRPQGLRILGVTDGGFIFRRAFAAPRPFRRRSGAVVSTGSMPSPSSPGCDATAGQLWVGLDARGQEARRRWLWVVAKPRPVGSRVPPSWRHSAGSHVGASLEFLRRKSGGPRPRRTAMSPCGSLKMRSKAPSSLTRSYPAEPAHEDLDAADSRRAMGSPGLPTASCRSSRPSGVAPIKKP